MQRCVGLAKGLAQRAWASQAAPSAIKHVWCRSRTVASLSFVPIGRRGRVATRETANSASNAVPTWFTRWYATGFDDVNHFHHVCDEVLEQLSAFLVLVAQASTRFEDCCLGRRTFARVRFATLVSVYCRMPNR